MKEEEKEQLTLLIALKNSKYWPAVKEFARVSDGNILTSLGTLDPNTQATELARSQGMRLGLYALEQTILAEEAKRERAANGEKDPEEEEFTGY